LADKVKREMFHNFWSYTAPTETDAIADINTSGYFNDASSILEGW
jgi:hypothetical protein